MLRGFTIIWGQKCVKKCCGHCTFFPVGMHSFWPCLWLCPVWRVEWVGRWQWRATVQGLCLSWCLAKGERLEIVTCCDWEEQKMKITLMEWKLISGGGRATGLVFMKQHWDMETQAELFISLLTKYKTGWGRWKFFPFLHSMQHFPLSAPRRLSLGHLSVVWSSCIRTVAETMVLKRSWHS